MVALYSLGVYCYYLFIRIAAFWNPKARAWVSGRQNWYDEWKQHISNSREWIWFHCASLGEFEQGRPVIETLKIHHPEKKILVTFFSPSGYEIQKSYPMADFVGYLPLDTAKNARRFIQLVQPVKVFFVKYEFWYHFLKQSSKSGIPVYLISGIFRSNQRFFKWWGSWFRKSLTYFDHFFVQNKHSARLLNKSGFNNVSVTGDTRFDRVHEIVQAPKSFPVLEAFKADEPLIVAGSSWDPEEQMLEEFLQKNPTTEVKLIIAPHQIHTEKIEILLNRYNRYGVICFTEIKNTKQLAEKRVIIMNTMGMLTSVYQYADVAVVGGAFGKGLHNILEPAAYGIPVIFGPKYQKFQEAVDLVEKRGAFSVNKDHEFMDILNDLLHFSEKRNTAGEICKKYIQESLGASKKILRHVLHSRKN